MKNLLILTVSILTINFGVLSAQTNKGTIFIGGTTAQNFTETGYNFMSLGYSSGTTKADIDGYESPDPTKLFSVNLMPKAGYFVLDNLVVGLDVNLAFSKINYGSNSGEYSELMIGAGPFIRYYIPKTKILPFFELKSLYGTIKDKTNYLFSGELFEYESNASVLTFGGGVGIAVPIGKKVNFDILVGYDYYTIKETEDNESNYRDVVGTIGLKLGFTILLGSDKNE